MDEIPTETQRVRFIVRLFWLSVILVLCAPTVGFLVFGEEYRWGFSLWMWL